ncbi:MAG: hypothetical protein J5881_02315 [Clostridia bacterium]|nr:hypothetical protein [Clostridia bacterium]
MGIDLVNKNQRFSGRKNLKINEKIELFEEYLNNGNTGKTIIYDTIYEGYPIGMYLKTIRYELNDEEKAKKYSEETINKLASLGLLDDKHESTITKKIDRLIEFVQNNPELWEFSYHKTIDTIINEFFEENIDEEKREELIKQLEMANKDYDYIHSRNKKGKISEADIERLKEAGIGRAFGKSNKQQRIMDEYGIGNEAFKYIINHYGSLEDFYIAYIDTLMKGNIEKIINKKLLGQNKLIKYFDLNASDFIYRDNQGYLELLETLMGEKIIIIKDKNEIFKIVNEILQSVNDKKANMVRMYYGLDGYKKMPYQQIGEQYGITRERVRQLMEKSIRILGLSKEKLQTVENFIVNYNMEEEVVRRFVIEYFKKYSVFYTKNKRKIDKKVQKEFKSFLRKKVKDGMETEKNVNTLIVNLELSPRIYNCLNEAGIYTVRGVTNKTEKEMIYILGENSFNRLKERIYSLGLSFKEETKKEIEYNTPIEELNLSVRSYNALKKCGVKTLVELAKKKESELKKLDNFGAKSLAEINTILNALGLELKRDEKQKKHKIREKQEIGYDIKIEELGFSTRTYNTLKRGKANTFGDLINTTEDEFYNMWGFGRKAMNEIKEKVHSMGFTLIDEDEELEETKIVTAQEMGEAGFEVGIGDIDKFDETEKELENLVEKEKEGGNK